MLIEIIDYDGANCTQCGEPLGYEPNHDSPWLCAFCEVESEFAEEGLGD